MDFLDRLPDRPLTFDEFQAVQRMDVFDAVYTLDKPGRIDILFLLIGDTEYQVEHSEEEGWHPTQNTKRE